MALEVTPFYRNLRTRVTFLGLEAEDLFAIMAVAVVANVLGRFLNRQMLGLPMNMVLQYIVPLLSIPALMLFKYGKQRGYLFDWVMFHGMAPGASPGENSSSPMVAATSPWC